MAKLKFPFIGWLIHQRKNHNSQNWLRAIFGYWYPETEQIYTKPKGGKIRIIYSVAMLLWLILLQLTLAAAKSLLRIGAVLFNIDGNKAFIKKRWPAQNFIPLPPLKALGAAAMKAWQLLITKGKPVAQGISCGGNMVRIIGEQRDYWIIECIKPFTGSPPKVKPSTHPWLFAWLYEVQAGTGDVRKGGLIWPLFSKTGKAFVHKSLVQFTPEKP